jgi:hypothetical protein
MSQDKHASVVVAELARDLTVASNAKDPDDMAQAFRLFYATILAAGRLAEDKDPQALSERLLAEYRGA